MKKCKVFLTQMLCFFYIMTPFISTGQSFKVVDFERLLRNHPISKNYDPETGRFKNTASEIIPLDRLAEEIDTLEQQIKDIQLEKASMVSASIIESFEADAENDVWQRIESYDQRIKKLDETLTQKKSLYKSSGIPEASTVLAVINEIHQDVRQQHIDPSLSSSIILNKLPAFPVDIPEINQETNGLLNYFYTRNPASFNNYISSNYSIGMLFKSLDLPILYKAGE